VPPRISKLLIVDASVVRAAGESEHPISSANRNFLNAVLEICHRVAMTTQIGDEWRRHQSKATRRWKLAMYARKKIVLLYVSTNPELRLRLTQAHSPEETEAILKDAHLIEAALRADRIVASLDENARALFNTAELNSVTWVNPVSERARIQKWLEQGAPPVEEWKLGHQS
jgi:hypothetical protein